MSTQPGLPPKPKKYLLSSAGNTEFAVVLALSEHDLLACLGCDSRNADIADLPIIPAEIALWRALDHRTNPGVVVLHRWDKCQLQAHLAEHLEPTVE